jgi:hypothetical protein
MSKIELDLNANARFICYASVTRLDSGVENRPSKLKMKIGKTVSNDVAMKPARLSGGGGRFKHTTAPLDQMARVFRSLWKAFHKERYAKVEVMCSSLVSRAK